MVTTTTREIGAAPGPLNFASLEKRFGMTRQDVYALALMEALALQFGHQPRQTSPTTWEVDSRSEPGTVRHQWLVGHRLFCDCPAAHGDRAPHRAPRICTHTAAVHLLLCAQWGTEPPVRPMSPEVLRYDPSPEAKAALALIERPRKPKAQPAPAQDERQPLPATAA